jgi:hypothetical protein
MERRYLIVATNGISILNLRITFIADNQTEDEFFDEIMEKVQAEKGYENSVITSIIDLTDIVSKLKE